MVGEGVTLLRMGKGGSGLETGNEGVETSKDGSGQGHRGGDLGPSHKEVYRVIWDLYCFPSPLEATWGRKGGRRGEVERRPKGARLTREGKTLLLGLNRDVPCT